MRTSPILLALALITDTTDGFITPHISKIPNRISQHDFSTLKQLHMANSPVDEAIELYQQKYPKKDTSSNTRPFWSSWGMPSTDIDGTKYKVSKSGSKTGRTLYDIDVKQQRATFVALSKVYGKDLALDMCRTEPGILVFDPINFAPSFREFSKIFGEDEARGMVKRNPGLLAVKPSGYGGADQASEQTMQMSYVVEATRPLGPVLLSGLLGLLMIPVLEGVLGVPLRANLFHSIFG